MKLTSTTGSGTDSSAEAAESGWIWLNWISFASGTSSTSEHISGDQNCRVWTCMGNAKQSLYVCTYLYKFNLCAPRARPPYTARTGNTAPCCTIISNQRNKISVCINRGLCWQMAPTYVLQFSSATSYSLPFHLLHLHMLYPARLPTCNYHP